jgi:hypothetical protein
MGTIYQYFSRNINKEISIYMGTNRNYILRLINQKTISYALILRDFGGNFRLVQANAPSTKTTLFFPTLTLSGTSGSGTASVEPAIIYRQAVGSSTVDVFIRLTNRGTASVGVLWVVNTFVP